ncbi:hypothetical protein [Nocardia fusca]|uniref:hypothetical protein n=1 Tax=Nocardia fusca TaxID=941183 RepID=UPI0007A75988|nr:hypothetical protein [Nocardia fusca]
MLHGFLPAPATGEALHSILFFGGNGLAGHLAVLAAGAGIALLVTLGIDVIKRRRNPDAAPPRGTHRTGPAAAVPPLTPVVPSIR